MSSLRGSVRAGISPRSTARRTIAEQRAYRSAQNGDHGPAGPAAAAAVQASVAGSPYAAEITAGA